MIFQMTKTIDKNARANYKTCRSDPKNECSEFSSHMQNSERVILQITKRPSRLQNGADYIPRSSGVPQREFCRGFCNVQDYKKNLEEIIKHFEIFTCRLQKAKSRCQNAPVRLQNGDFRLQKNKKVQSCGKEPEIKTQREF